MEDEDNERPVDCDKPRFYYQDLDNYHEEFLKEIILWQRDKIEDLGKIINNNQK